MFDIEMLPACEGDALWISYGSPDDVRHILIDGGRKSTAGAIRRRIEALAPEQRRFELVVVTHIDRDHIEGMIDILEGGFYGAKVEDFWFNNYDHLKMAEAGKIEAMGAVMGERLSEHIQRLALNWNKAFDKGPVCVGDTPLERRLQGGLKLTILSPTREKLLKLMPVWQSECAKAGIPAGGQVQDEPEPPPPGVEALGGLDIDRLALTPFVEDRTEPNGSSIAMIAEYEGRRILLGADAHCDVLEAQLGALRAGGPPLKLDAFKLAHHGSKANLSRALLENINCRRYLVSTNGSYFNHPDREAIARIIRYGGDRAEFVFNYRSEENEVWDDADLRQREGYAVSYPSADRAESFIRVSL